MAAFIIFFISKITYNSVLADFALKINGVFKNKYNYIISVLYYVKGMIIMLIGERLAELRKDKELTQKELASILFINFRTYCSYEREEYEASDNIKIKIAKYFNVSLDYLLGLIDNPRPIEEGYEYMRLSKKLGEEDRQHLKQYLNYLVRGDKKP